MANLSLVLVCALLYVGAVTCLIKSKLCYYKNVKDARFNYDGGHCEGPKNWCTITDCWTTCGSKLRQSPININTRKALPIYGRKNFVLENIHRRVSATIFNNGHAPGFNVAVDKNNKKNIILTKVPRKPSNEKYIFAQLHVHVGQKDKGSEHSIDGKFYPMEAHMVFYNSKYDNIAKAKPAEDGLVVIGVMLKAKRKDGDEDDEYDDDGERQRGKRECGRCKVRFARRLSFIMERYYKKVREPKSSRSPEPQHTVPKDLKCGKPQSQKTIENKCIKKGSENSDAVSVSYGISPQDVLPDDKRFYTYLGSLTTPPCYETVQWIVFKCPIVVSRGAFEALRKVKDSHGRPLSALGIRRPIQPGNIKQKVFKNF
ncbi:nacrein-like protein [Ostrea edulis]|uniref:nacrein-like protein n=1 Tax=Ostrea edulis TaxID=37623 RepID=UPI0024AF2393|nr:nacrein-like protein [Ostrea edulis]